MTIVSTDHDAVARGRERYGPQNAVTEPKCDQCGHGRDDHNASGTGKACDRCGCGVFHGIGASADGRPKPMTGLDDLRNS